MFEAIEARFGGNEATKKTQKTLLKQMYENFNASSSKSLDSIFTRLQKIISQLAILGENISQEDLNFKFLRSLPSEWSMHVVVWRNKPDLGSISFDDLYNNFKIVEQEVKRSVISSSNSSSQNVAFVSTPGSTNDVNTSNVHVSTASSSLSTASTTDNTARLSDATIYAFLANQLNGSQVVHEDLEQIHEDDLEEIDLKWQLALLSMKARKFYQITGKKIIINGSDTAGYDKIKVECFNCHKMGHFARECRNPRSQDYMSRNQDSSRKTMNVEEYSSKSMLAIDGVHNNKTCTKICLKSFEDLKSQYDNLRTELNKFEFDLANYKRGLASVEEQLVFYKKNEGMLCDQIVVLKRDASFNESEINALKIQIERLKKEKESNQIKIDNFENASKSLDKLIGCQISDNNRKGVGYNVVAPPLIGLFAPPTIDLSKSGLEEFKQPEFEGYGVKVNKSVSENSSNEIKKTSGAPIIEDWVSDCDEDETLEKVSESANVQKPKQADQPRKISQNPRNNSTNWNTPMSKKLGVGFQFTPKACFVCGSFNHLIKDCDFHDKKMVQKPVLNNVKKRLVKEKLDHTARQSSSRAATSVSTAMPIKTAAPKPFVNVVNSVNTAKGKKVISVVGEQGINVVKSKACWVWRPKIKVLDHVSKNNGSYICKQFDYVDPTGLEFKVLVAYHTTNGHQFHQSNRTKKEIGYFQGKALEKNSPKPISKIDCLLSSEVLFERRLMMSIMHSIPLTKVGDEAVHKELGDRMERDVTKLCPFEANSRLKLEAYQGFEDMLKGFDREDLDTLWSLVKGRFRPAEPSEDMEKALWVKLKRLFESDKDDVLWKLQRYMHDPLTWRLYGSSGVHHVSSTRGQDIFMLVEKDYPLTKGLAILMLSNKLRVDQQSEMADELLTKIYNIANRPRK
ncbi:ribonuclease H-like domain-containing protein [Tanacetum coccineum]